MTYDYALILYFGSHESFLGAIRCQDRTTSIIILSSRNTSACCRGCRYHIPLITENDLILISCGSAADIGFSPHSRCRRPFLLRTLEVASCSGLTVLWFFSYFLSAMPHIHHRESSFELFALRSFCKLECSSIVECYLRSE